MKWKDMKDDGSSQMQEFFRIAFCHPDIVSASVEFDHWSAAASLPEPLVSDVQRSKERNAQIYFDRYSFLRSKAAKEDFSGLSEDDEALAKLCLGKSDNELRKEAQGRTSWHCFGCAIDFSGRPYNLDQLAHADTFFKERFQGPLWEYKRHVVVGEHPHFHLGRRDFSFRSKFQMKS